MTNDLTAAVAEIKRVSPASSPWEAGDIGVGQSPVDYQIAVILNAVASGELAPAADVQGLPTGKEMSASDFDCLILDAIAEAMKAMRKFPQPNYVISKIAEEAGEVVKAAIHCAEGRETAENLRGEMKQLIAMLYRLWVEGDQVHGLKPVAAWENRNG